VLPLHEVNRLISKLIVDLGAHPRRERLDLMQWAARTGLNDMRTLGEQRFRRRVYGVGEGDGVRVGRRVPRGAGRYAVEFVKAMCSRQALRIAAQVPLAENCGRVAKPMEHVTHRESFRRERAVAAADDDERKSISNRILPGHQRDSRWCAGRLDQKLS
jgi:hypothetical protein